LFYLQSQHLHTAVVGDYCTGNSMTTHYLTFFSNITVLFTGQHDYVQERNKKCKLQQTEGFPVVANFLRPQHYHFCLL